MLTHGSSGSGKTVATQGLLEACGAIRFRADVERKRLFGMQALQRGDARLQARLLRTKPARPCSSALRDLAASALQSGYSVILDATFLAREARAGARVGVKPEEWVSRSCISKPGPTRCASACASVCSVLTMRRRRPGGAGIASWPRPSRCRTTNPTPSSRWMPSSHCGHRRIGSRCNGAWAGSAAQPLRAQPAALAAAGACTFGMPAPPSARAS